MKKVWTRMICSVLLFACCILPSTAMAVEGKEANVIVTVEHEEKDIFEMYGNVFEESMVESRKSTVDLSSGSVAFTVGVLDAGEKYTTDTYDKDRTDHGGSGRYGQPLLRTHAGRYDYDTEC